MGPINPKSGLHQGDPLSPYLFLFCVEGLSLSISKAAGMDRIHGCKISSSAPAVTYLLFADDSFLFYKATSEETLEIKTILARYEVLSGQAINLQKSGIFFSANVRRDKQQEIKDMLGVHNDLSTGHYLGLPSLIGRSKKAVFGFLKERLRKKIQGWSSKCLSRAGRAVLLRNVAQEIPTYTMFCFLLPRSLCQELQRMMNSFWWGSRTNSSKGIRWLSWDMCMSKDNGGMGFRDLFDFNLALLGKQCWNFLIRPHSLVARIFKARYFPSTDFLNAERKGRSSFLWSGLCRQKSI